MKAKESHEGLKFNGILQLLVGVNDINLFGKAININKNTKFY
jgi:hypothetical protein